MIIKKYQGKSESEIIKVVEEELGKDAIIMNVRTIHPKGISKLFRKTVVEVTAALDDQVNYKKDRLKANQSFLNKDVQVEDSNNSGSEFLENMPKTEEGSFAIEEKLNNLQTLLEKQIEKENQDKKDNNPIDDSTNKSESFEYMQLIYNQLVLNEVDEKYANQIVEEIENNLKHDSPMDFVLASVYQKIILKLGQTKTIEMKEDGPKFIFFIGSTGVGKTTTIAKIASSYKIKEKAKIGFINLDTYRIAATQQLMTYADILGAPLKVVYTAAEMKDVKKEFADFDLVFVDTAGRSHRVKEQRDDLENFLNTVEDEDKEVYLVLSATTKYRDLIKIAEVYNDIANYKLIFTKFDETSSLGNIYNIKMLTGAPLSYATFGQNVPDDIEAIDAQNIAKHLLRGQ